jgi:hypothetical protein
MRPPIFVRSLSDTEKEQLKTALRSTDSFVMRRAQIVLASDRRERAPRIARSLGCGCAHEEHLSIPQEVA